MRWLGVMAEEGGARVEYDGGWVRWRRAGDEGWERWWTGC